MFRVKHTIAVLALISAVAHAQSVGGNSGVGHGARGAVGAGAGASHGTAAGASQSGSNGGRYSAFDNYQPWPQAEMKQYAKAKFTSYAGE